MRPAGTPIKRITACTTSPTASEMRAPINEAAQDIPAEVIGPEPVIPARWLGKSAVILRGVVVGGDKRRKYRNQVRGPRARSPRHGQSGAKQAPECLGQSPVVFAGWERAPSGRSTVAAVPKTDGSATTAAAFQGDRGWQTDFLPVAFPGTGEIADQAVQAAQASPATPYDPITHDLITRLSGGRVADR